MVLDQVATQQSVIAQTPLWVTIIGWLVTIFAAILPSVINYFHNRKLRKDVDALQSAKKLAIDKVKFGEQRIEIIDSLKKYIKALERNVNGKNTVANLSRTLATVQSYAERLEFSTDDKKTIHELLMLTRDMQMSNDISCNNITSDMIQGIIEILSKGEYLV